MNDDQKNQVKNLAQGAGLTIILLAIVNAIFYLVFDKILASVIGAESAQNLRELTALILGIVAAGAFIAMGLDSGVF